MIGADIHRIPFRHFARGEQDRVLDQPHRGRRREHVSAARQVFFDNVILRRALQLGPRHALLVGDCDIKREQPGSRRVDGHRGVHLAKRDRREQRPHVAEMADRHADLADFALGLRMVAVVAGLGRQIEGDRKAGLPLAQILAIELVRRSGGRMPGIGPEDPGFIAQRFVAARLVGHRSSPLSGATTVTRFLLQRNTRGA